MAPGPGPSWGAELEGLRHCPTRCLSPISAEPAGPSKTAAPDKSTIGTCFACRPGGGSAGPWVVGSGGKGLAALWACYQQPCPTPSPLAPLKFTHLIRGANLLREGCYAFVPSAFRLARPLPSGDCGGGGAHAGKKDLALGHNRGPSSHTHRPGLRECSAWVLSPSLPSTLHPCIKPAAPPTLSSFHPDFFSYSVPGGRAQPPIPSHVPDRRSSEIQVCYSLISRHTFSKCLLNIYYTPGTGARQ